MKKILYYLVPLATAFLLCGCLKDMKDGELLHGNREEIGYLQIVCVNPISYRA